MDGYKEPQWRFLLSGADVVTAAIIQQSGDNNKESSVDLHVRYQSMRIHMD